MKPQASDLMHERRVTDREEEGLMDLCALYCAVITHPS